MARAAHLRHRFHAGGRSAMIAVTAVAGRSRNIVPFKKSDSVNAAREFIKLICWNAVPLHQTCVTVTFGACRGNVRGIDTRFHIFGRPYVVTAMAAGTLRSAEIPLRIPDAMDARLVFVQLIDGNRRVIGAHVRGISMTLRTRLHHIERIHRRGNILHRNDPMSRVARNTLDDMLPAVR